MMDKNPTSLDVIANEMKHISADVTEIKTTLRGSYVSKDEFEPIKKLVYGLAGLVLTSVAVGVVGLVIL